MRTAIPSKNNAIIPAAFGMLRTLPEACFPAELVLKFPRIVNKLADLWPNAQKTLGYLDELLIVDRSGRQGFPEEIVRELIALQSHCLDRLPPPKPCPWLDGNDGAVVARELRVIDFH